MMLSPRNAILASTAMDLVAFGMALPVLSFVMTEHGASPQVQGLIASAYSALQFFSCPVLGRLSDRVGRVPLLLLSATSNAVGLVGISFAPTLYAYAIFRLLPGVLKCNLTVGQAYVADITDHKGRTAGMGVLGVAFGLGFVVGPAVGGALSSWGGYPAPLRGGALLCLANLAFISLAVPETSGPRAVNSAVLGYIGFLAALTNGVLVQGAVRRWGEHRLVHPLVAVMGAALAGWAIWAPSPWGRAVVLVPLAVAGASFSTVTSSILSKAVPPESVGGLLGLAGSVDTVARTVAPLVGGWLAGAFGDPAVELCGAALCTYLFACIAIVGVAGGAPGGEEKKL